MESFLLLEFSKPLLNLKNKPNIKYSKFRIYNALYYSKYRLLW